MKRESRIAELQKNLSSNLEENPIEDGNTDSIAQGILYTSEINDSDSYENTYEALVLQVLPDKNRTGTNNIYKLIIKYLIHNSIANEWYGKNLVKSGDSFVILNKESQYDFNYIKGSIIQIIDAYEGGTDPKEITYEIICSITEGNPGDLSLDGGQILKTNRRLYVDELYNSPINLYSTYSYENQKLFFYWDDITQLAVSYKLQIRSADALNKYIFEVNGNSVDFTGSVIPLIFNAGESYPPNKLTALKIEDVGRYMSLNKYTPTFITGGTPPIANLYTTNTGELEITNWLLLDVISYTDFTIELIIKNNGIECKTELVQSFGGLRNLQYVEIQDIANQFIIDNITQTDSYYTIKLLSQNTLTYIDLQQAKTNLIKKNIKIHTGVHIIDAGDNLLKLPKIVYDKYPNNIKYIIDNTFASGTYYWSVSSVFNGNKKIYSEWSPEEILIIK